MITIQRYRHDDDDCLMSDWFNTSSSSAIRVIKCEFVDVCGCATRKKQVAGSKKVKTSQTRHELTKHIILLIISYNTFPWDREARNTDNA